MPARRCASLRLCSEATEARDMMIAAVYDAYDVNVCFAFCGELMSLSATPNYASGRIALSI
jgi:hypothetical protein